MESWKAKFSASVVTHLFLQASDHAPLLLQIKNHRSGHAREPKSFKFEESWLLWEECEAMVHEAWTKSVEMGSGLNRIKERIALCGTDLHVWGSSRIHPDTKRIKALQKRVEDLNKGETTNDNKAEFLDTSKELDDLLVKQEIYWAQCSRISWLKHGDKNTKFFHSKASNRRRRNMIQGIRTQDSKWVEDISDIAQVATSYFEGMFTAGTCNRLEDCLNAVHHKIADDMKDILTSECSADEIKAALFQMGPTKAPRPDGMNALFYQKFWHIVGDDVVAAVLDFLNSGNMDPSVNYTHIVLIPKIKSPEKMSDYRPISLCNAIYKIISKVLANKLKQILP